MGVFVFCMCCLEIQTIDIVISPEEVTIVETLTFLCVNDLLLTKNLFNIYPIIYCCIPQEL